MTVTLRLFAAAREAAGRGVTSSTASTRSRRSARSSTRRRRRTGPTFAAVLGERRVWVNGDEPAARPGDALADGDEVAVLPPVSGGIA